MRHLDWSHLHSFVAVAEHGSLSAAARAHNSSQPTLSRHIALLEQSLSARLFNRTKTGVTLTDKGHALMVHAGEMADAAARLSILSEGGENTMTGTVRITASQIVATYILPPVLTELHQRHPNIEIELVASDDTNNLLRREADIAVRMYRPTQKDVIAKHIGTLEMGAYASRDYIARRGMLGALENILAHDLVGYDNNTMIIDGMAAMGMHVDRAAFKFRSDDQVVCWQMVRAGFGIGFNQNLIAQSEADLVCVSGPSPVGELPVWLAAHSELRQTPRIRKVYDALGEMLGRKLSSGQV
ncbi:LysR family transcriptional regulator [Sulfitobacter sp. M57]|uniref:LysR family transcriptional regulator n=1 Tax=unclassified Sulfitobacter TaxID=196795 RepID=UPI0023E0ADB3|nr:MULTISPECIES: LysR family transcriptional regulator [unclassified Sulfitobacter]MDF3414263.1 LysR family transcriptional regulator [Sulfitobacter sp. KE5]MDF3420455.1 LysR family transcriptional regulator [Sulfitobacter sp. KE43]MDF3432809.1 LysR family transcriptional regulator [Sulfitobacter sp. KE42]MDF3458449.1 LysR family transcriptional regulator [Sulfitobacter sp. S74]MDF3462349.1 LysR family transcriptional regulator [Sulfitobacter sp. Ks18]